MAKKINNAITLKWFNGNTEVASSTDATHLLMTREGVQGIIKIDDKDVVQSALTFWSDGVYLGKYDNPLTDWEKGVHVYALAAGPYYEDAATMLVGDDWWSADLKMVKGTLQLVPNHMLDPINHADELVTERVARAEKRGRPLTIKQIDAIKSNEFERALGDKNRILKHNWAEYRDYGFKVFIAHIRPYADKVFSTLSLPVEEAKKQRSELTSDSVARRKFYRNGIATSVPSNVEPETDEPEEATSAPAAESAGLVVQFAKNGKLTGQTVDLMKLQKGVLVNLWIINGNRMVDANWDRLFDPENAALIAAYRDYATPTASGKPRYAFEFDEHFLQN